MYCPLWGVVTILHLGKLRCPELRLNPGFLSHFVLPRRVLGSHDEAFGSSWPPEDFLLFPGEVQPPWTSEKTPGTCGGQGASGPGVDPHVGRGQR